MTAQIFESLIFNGEMLSLASEPLSSYLEKLDPAVDLLFEHTACWRCYVGTWEITDDKLFLVDLKAHLKDRTPIGLNYFFPMQKRAFADWYSGELRIPQGNLLTYVHGGFISTFEKDLFINVERGLVKEVRFRDNIFDYLKNLLQKGDNGDDLPF